MQGGGAGFLLASQLCLATFLSIAWTMLGKLAAYDMNVTEALTEEEIV